MTRSIGALLLAAILFTGNAVAAELKIVSGGAAKAGLTDGIALYEKATGDKVTVDYLPAGPMMKALSEGATPDIVVSAAEGMADAKAKGFVTGAETEIGRVGIGVCVKDDAPSPDISTPAALKATLLAAKSIVYIDPKIGTSGKHLAEVFAKLGVLDAVNAKAKLGTGGYVTEPVGKGEIELGLHQITEMLPVKGLKVVGPLPAELQKVTIYVGAAGAKAKEPAAAAKFLAFMRTAEVRAAFAKRGFME